MKKPEKIWAMFFSPTGTTEKIAKTIARQLDPKASIFNFTLPVTRTEGIAFGEDDLVVFGVPVYAGRVPNVLLKYLSTIKGQGAMAVPVVVFGNRNYDDALIELQHILKDNGFRTIAAAAFVGEHSFSRILGAGRPDDKDLKLARDFADSIDFDGSREPEINGHWPLEGYYKPRDHEGVFIDIRKVKPKTSEACVDCKICARVCPMGAIDYHQITEFTGICIKCGACIKKCPSGAKYYDDSGYLYHKSELEEMYTRRAEPELFL